MTTNQANENNTINENQNVEDAESSNNRKTGHFINENTMINFTKNETSLNTFAKNENNIQKSYQAKTNIIPHNEEPPLMLEYKVNYKFANGAIYTGNKYK